MFTFNYSFFLFVNIEIITKFKTFKLMLLIATKNEIKNCDKTDDNDENVFDIITQKKRVKMKFKI